MITELSRHHEHKDIRVAHPVTDTAVWSFASGVTGQITLTGWALAIPDNTEATLFMGVNASGNRLLDLGYGLTHDSRSIVPPMTLPANSGVFVTSTSGVRGVLYGYVD